MSPSHSFYLNMKASIHRSDPSQEFFTDERCHILEHLNGKGYPFSLAQARVEPGITTMLHALRDVHEAYYIVSGEGLMEVGTELTDKVGSGDVVYIPAGEAQRITNIGTEDLIFLCICTPRFVVECYEGLEG